MSNMNQRFRFAGALLALLVLATAVDRSSPAMAAEAATPAPVEKSGEPKPPTVTVIKAEAKEIVDRAIVSGSLVAREEVQVSAEIDGMRITDVLVEEGDSVVAGQVLARLSHQTLDIQLEQMKAQLARNEAAISQGQAAIAEAQASSKEMSKSLDRAKALRKNDVVSSAVLDTRDAAASTAIARVQSAEKSLEAARADKKAMEAQIAELEVRIARAEVKASKGGVITTKTAKVGSMASGAAGPLFTLIANGEIELEAEVPEVVLPKIHQGLMASVRPTGFDKDIAGKVRLVRPDIDPQTRLGKVRISLAADPNIRVGSFARAVIEVSRRQGLMIPLTAISYDGGTTLIQVVTDGKVRSRPVHIGLVSGAFAEITIGLKDGEVVVERAGSFLRDGDIVTPLEAATVEAQK